jgi:hypothetical protein
MATLKKTVSAVKRDTSTSTKSSAVSGGKAAPAKKVPAKKSGATPVKVKPTWMAPADFKPAFFNFTFQTDSQALIVPESVQGTRYRGRWDNPEAKTFDMRDYDVSSLIGFASRMSAAIWAPNVVRRITPDASWRLVLRVAKRSTDGSLAARIIGVAIKKEGKKARWIEDKTDVDLRKIRRAARWLPAAFTDVQLPPSTRRSSKKEEDAEE